MDGEVRAMFRLKFWVALAVLSVLILGAGYTRLAILRARNPMEPRVIAVPHPALGKEDRMTAPRPGAARGERRAVRRARMGH
jgi:hypothetical protein